ncbi:MAG: hypothetical protein IJ091_05020 [Oscillospiraceae bacterium]|nr:hypothetical protein [Oscillospiraceae bacterium]
MSKQEFVISPELQERLDRLDVKFNKEEKWYVYCPVCEIRLMDETDPTGGIIKIYCKKCKKTVPVDLKIYRRKEKSRHLGRQRKAG